MLYAFLARLLHWKKAERPEEKFFRQLVALDRSIERDSK